MSRRAPAASSHDGGGDSGVMDFDSSLAQLSRALSKLERMQERIGTAADNGDFRDLLQSEQQSATFLARQILSHVRTVRAQSQARAFEREYARYTRVMEKIDTKRKQVMVAVARRDNNAIGDDIIREETASGRGNSYVESALPQLAQTQAQQGAANDSSIVFLEYRVDELQKRHLQIKQVEHDIVEIAEMWRDLQTMVDEQQVHIDVIETNINTTKEKVETGHKELQKAEEHQKSARKKVCCISVFAIIALLVLILVILGVKGQL